MPLRGTARLRKGLNRSPPHPRNVLGNIVGVGAELLPCLGGVVPALARGQAGDIERNRVDLILGKNLWKEAVHKGAESRSLGMSFTPRQKGGDGGRLVSELLSGEAVGAFGLMLELAFLTAH